jgi:hypothetical protein
MTYNDMVHSLEKDSRAELLDQVLGMYRESFQNYRGDFGLLDSEKWFKDLQVDYILEVFLANLNYTTLICENILEQTKNESENSERQYMPDYDLGYKIAEDCTSVMEFAFQNQEYVRDSLTTELFFAFIQYFNISNSANRFGWFDVNKRLASVLVQLVQFNPELREILNEWAQDIDGLDEDDLEDDELSPQLLWKHEFISSVRENTESNLGSDY